MVATYHCYCAICSAPLQRPDVGSTSTQALEARWSRIDRIKALRVAGEEEDEEDEDDEIQSYDPTLLNKEKNLKWISDVVCLGFNESVPNGGKAFLSGKADYDDTGHIELEMGDDPNQPADHTDFSCYYHHKDHEIYYPWGVFPFHQKCLGLVSMVLTGSMQSDNIDKDVLYRVMDGLGGNGSALCLNYGRITGPDQDWMSVPGEEFSVCDPVDVPGVSKLLHEKMASDMFKRTSEEVLDLGKKVAKDPFGNLPYDIIHALSSYLPAESLLALINASWPVRCATQHNTMFWTNRIFSQMAWFWELKDMIQDLERKDFDYQRFYFWLEKETTPTYGMRSGFLGISNRRRVWLPCEEIAEAYFKKVGTKECPEGDQNNEQA